MAYISLIVIIIIVLILIIPLGKYIYQIINYDNTLGEGLFGPIERLIYKLCGIDRQEEMNWKKYATSFLLLNILMLLFAYIIFRVQGVLPYNPTGARGLNPLLAFNSAISFVTNTNIQHYAGESDMAYSSVFLVIIFLMFTSAASGIATAAAIMRAIAKKTENLGSFYVDFIRVIIRLLLPLSMVVTLILVSQGVPQTLNSRVVVDTLEGAKQIISVGPVAVLESIKHIGTNGGGFFSANSAHPFENPSSFTNLIETISMMIIPLSLVYTFGLMIRNKKHSKIIISSLLVLFIVLGVGLIFAEFHPGNYITGTGISTTYGNMEGKEMRFGTGGSSIFTAVSTAFTTGTVNSSLDSYTPLGGGVPMIFMMLNTVFGGAGVGLENIIMYVILTVFITGLMVGRTPEYLGNKIEAKEVKLVAISILIHPLLILFATAITLVSNQGLNSITVGGFHGLSQLIYEFTSASANNGSEFAGILGNTNFMNFITAVVMFSGRYLPILLMLAVAGSMARKTKLEPSPGTFRTDNLLFGSLFIAVIIIVGALTFFPVLVLGPISEFLSLV